jgi:hypothetical protein
VKFTTPSRDLDVLQRRKMHDLLQEQPTNQQTNKQRAAKKKHTYT